MIKILSNWLKVLLISDPYINKNSALLGKNIEYLVNKKYPDENE